jgi:hypothetical protein
MTLLRSLPENATLADLRRTYADLLEKLLEAHSLHGNEAMFKERGPMRGPCLHIANPEHASARIGKFGRVKRNHRSTSCLPGARPGAYNLRQPPGGP